MRLNGGKNIIGAIFLVSIMTSLSILGPIGIGEAIEKDLKNINPNCFDLKNSKFRGLIEKIESSLDSEIQESNFLKNDDGENTDFYYIYEWLLRFVYELTFHNMGIPPAFMAVLMIDIILILAGLFTLSIPVATIAGYILFVVMWYPLLVFWFDSVLHTTSSTIIFYLADKYTKLPIDNAEIIVTPVGYTNVLPEEFQEFTAKKVVTDKNISYVIHEYYQPPGYYDYKITAEKYNDIEGKTEGIPESKPNSAEPIPLYMEPSNPGSIGNFVWEDINRDGCQDSFENGLGGITVELYLSEGDQLGYTITNKTGYYSFDCLIPGCYFLKFINPDGYIFSPYHSCGENDDIDSNANANGVTPIIRVEQDGYDMSWDVGMYIY